eukprot:7434612-Alexandrium_andersonii.AAC.1
MSPSAARAASVASSEGLPCAGPPSARRPSSHCHTIAGPPPARPASSPLAHLVHPEDDGALGAA